MTRTTAGSKGAPAGLRGASGGAPVPGSNRPPDAGIELRDLTNALVGGSLLSSQAVPIEIRETHASLVFLTPSDVYKLKKPVDLSFLNYSTLRRRSRMCRQEVVLNRRLAPDVYLGADKVTRERDGSLRLNGRGRVIDYLVHMRRLPDGRSLDVLLRVGAITVEDIRRVGARIGVFHRDAIPAPRRFGPRTFLRNARENLLQLQASMGPAFPTPVVEELWGYFQSAQSRFRPVIEERAEAGRIRDGHGDLRAEHVYLEDGITIIDCIEFNPRYRLSDTALDFAFLAMDVAANGYPDLVNPLVQSYERSAGDNLTTVLPFYCWYRALVRAKVSSLLTREKHISGETRSAAALSLRRHVHHALRLARGDQRPLLLVVGGLPGTGKTTVARALGGAIGASVQGADETRKRLAGLGAGVHPATPIDAGLYSGQMNQRVYGALMAGASDALARGRSVVLDATFRRRNDREAARSLASRLGARFLMVECEAPDRVVIDRLRGRVKMPDPWSDATVETFHAYRARHGPPAELQRSECLTVVTTRPLITQVDRVLTFLWA
jgi:hypothetical protein